MPSQAAFTTQRTACLAIAWFMSVTAMVFLAPGTGRPLAHSSAANVNALACPDQDADGYARCDADCDPTGLVCGDCNDANPDSRPGAAEVCNHVDDDCDGRTDDGFPAVAGSQKVANPREGAEDQFGSAVAAIGDVTGDGVADLAVSALDPLEASILSGADRSVVCRMGDPVAINRFGAALAGIGDVTGDGVPDVAVGEPQWYSGSVPYIGVVGIFSGADCSLVRNCHASGCSVPSCGDNLGVSLAALGDVTGDGVPDILAGAPSFSNGFSNGNGIGRAIVFSGANCQVVAALQAPVPVQNSRFGTTVAEVGDLNQDGVLDFAVGTINTAQTYIYSGASRSLIRTLVESSLLTSFAGLPDLDGDGVSEFAAGAPFYDPSTGSQAGSVIIYSGASGARLRQCADPSGSSGDGLGSAVTNMGDMTGDGVAEFAAAAPGWDIAAGADAGSIVLFSSSDCSMVQRLTDPAASPGEQLGSGGVARVGDLNADGVAEVAAGARLDDAGGRTDSGSVLFFGLQSDCDGDGSTPFGGDCDDANPAVNPGAHEICDGIDNDCDGEVDGTSAGDTDGDGISDCSDSCPGDPDNDADADGICGDVDNCPSIPNPGQDPEACLQRVADITIDFKSSIGKGSGSVSWKTTHEMDLLGFNIVVTSSQGARIQLNSVLIPCEACITGEGITYTFTVPKHKSGRDIFIEAVRRDGSVERYGPAQRL